MYLFVQLLYGSMAIMGIFSTLQRVQVDTAGSESRATTPGLVWVNSALERFGCVLADNKFLLYGPVIWN